MSEAAQPLDGPSSAPKGHSGWRSRTKGYVQRDQRTREARLLRETRAELTAHVGGHPSATQRALIEQAGQLTLRIAAMDRRFAETDTMTDHDTRTYLAWCNSHRRLLHQLGFKPAAERPQSLHELLDEPAATAPRGEP